MLAVDVAARRPSPKVVGVAIGVYRLGVDFGTSTTVAVLAWPDGAVKPLVFDGSELLPSAVCLDGDGTLLVGRDAIHAARSKPEGFEPNPKRCVDDGAVLLSEVEEPPDWSSAAPSAEVEQYTFVIRRGLEDLLSPANRKVLEHELAAAAQSVCRIARDHGCNEHCEDGKQLSAREFHVRIRR